MISPGELGKCLHLFESMNRLKSHLQILHVIKNAKPKARRALVDLLTATR